MNKFMHRFNLNVAIKILLLIGFAFFFLNALFTGTYSLYVHPRMVPFMIFASIVMIVIALLLLGKLFSGNDRKSYRQLVFFIVPLILAFTIPAKTFDSSTASTGNIQLSAGTQELESDPTLDTSDSSENASSDQTYDEYNSDDLIMQNGVIVMDGNNFYECLSVIYTDLNKYFGTPIEVVGFVFNDGTYFASNEFVPARMMMSCCAADMTPVGFLCLYGKASELAADSWVKVTGTIGKAEYDGETIPCIVADQVESAEMPDDDYVYPY